MIRLTCIMNIERLLESYRKKIDNELDVFFVGLEERYRYLEEFTPFIRAMKDFSLRGGKKLRPILMIQGHNLIFPEEPEIIKASISIELVHNFLLVHDDIMDRDRMRRGNLTLNARFAGEFSSQTGEDQAAHLGDSTAMTCGDILFSLGNMVIGQASFSSDSRVLALKYLNRIITDVGVGQALDVLFGLKKDLSEEKILQMYDLKSAVYSFTCPVALGAILAGEEEGNIREIEAFTRPLGLAFQIKDDLLDLYGSESKTGKSVGADFREGKMTFLVTSMMRKGTPDQKAFISSCMGNLGISSKEIQNLQDIGRDCGAHDYCTGFIRDLIREAQRILRKSSYRREAVEVLLAVADYIHNRES
jgi:geranylgeranyl diphosphate synthase type I